MGGKSKSSTSSTQSSQTQNVQDIDTTTIGLEDVQDSIVGGAGDISVTQISTDQGSVEAGRRIGEAAFDFAGEFGGQALDTAQDATAMALDFGGDAINEAFNFGGKAIDSLTASSAQTSSALSGAITKAAEATRSDSAVVTQNIAKYGAILIGVVGLGIVAYFVFRG